MGSTGTRIEPGTNVRDYFDQQITTGNPNRTVLASNIAPIPGATKWDDWSHAYFAAVREDVDTSYGAPAGTVWAAVTLYKRTSHRWDCNLFYKDLSETCGPQAEGASRKVLDALTPTEHETALAWRKEADAYLANKATTVKAEPGDTILFAHPMKFSDDAAEYDTFTLEVYSTRTFRSGQTRRTLKLRRPATVHNEGKDCEFTQPGTFVSVPRWQDREHIVIRAAELATPAEKAA